MADEEQPPATPEDVDERRLNRAAYDYLCRLLEIRTWLVDCLKDEEVARPTELEANFRNGVMLARLSHAFAPDVVPLKNVYDVEQKKYRENEATPVYRHSDNIMQWRRAMESVHLPEIFIPETADVFEGRNMKTVFCLFALGTLLHRQRKTPPIRNVTGSAKFSNEEMAEMKESLRGSKLPEFGDVGRVLTDRRQQMDMQTRALDDIRRAVQEKDAAALVSALKSSEAGIEFVEESLASAYLDAFANVDTGAQFNKMFVQAMVIATNNESALVQLDLALDSENYDDLLPIFDVLQFEDVRKSALPLYVQLLQRERRNAEKPLDRHCVSEVISMANALVEVRVAVEHGSSEDALLALRHSALKIEPMASNAKLYYSRMQQEYAELAEDQFLTRNDLEFIILEFDDISADKREVLELNALLEKNDSEGVLHILTTSMYADVFMEQNLEYYIRKLNQKKAESANDVKAVIKEANDQTVKAFSQLDTLIRLNKAMQAQDESSTRLNLTSLAASIMCDSFRRELLHWYIRRLVKEGKTRHAEPSDEHKWFHHEFELGTVWAEINELHRSTMAKKPIESTFFSWAQIEEMLAEEDVSFDEYYSSRENNVIKSQNALRKYLDHKRKKELEAQQRSENEAASKIQSHYKSYRHRKDLELLKSSEIPSLSLVRKFVKTLPRNEVDLSQDIEVEEMKANVTQLMAANRQLDASLVELDEKIGLLIKNRLNLQEVMAHKDRVTESVDAFSMRACSIRKRDRPALAALEQLFFYLQTQPNHLANLIEAPRNDSTDLINDVVCPVFGFLSDNREQFLMVRLLCELIVRDVEKLKKIDETPTSSCVGVISDFFTSSVFDTVVCDPCRSISDVLQDFVDEESRVKTFNLDPMELYESLYAKKVETPEKALQDEQVSQVLSNSLTFLATWSETITEALFEKYKLPRYALYICVFLENALRRQFASATNADVEQITAQFAFEVFLSRSLTSARSHFRTLGKQLGEDAARRLECVLQFVGFAVLNRGYGNKKWYLTALNKQIHAIHARFIKFVMDSVRDVALDEVFGLNEYTQFDPFHKPTLSLLERHVNSVVDFLQQNSDVVCQNKKDLVATLIASAKVPQVTNGDKTLLLQLHPSPKENVVNGVADQTFVRAKKQVVDLLCCECAGSSLPELIATEPTATSEELRASLMPNDELTSIGDKQRKLADDLQKLEDEGRVSTADDFQTIVTDIANDIRLHARRQRERAEQKKSVEETRAKLLAQREEFREKLTSYEEYLETCLLNLTRTSRRLSFRPTTKEAGKIQKERASLDQIKTYKCSSVKLFRKGVLIDVAGYQTPKQLAKVSVEMSSTGEKGVFAVGIFQSGKLVDTLQLHFQDLLKADSVEEPTFLLQDKIVLDVSRTIQYINKKFYNK